MGQSDPNYEAFSGVGALVGFYLTFIVIELVVAVPTYYLLRALLKSKKLYVAALVACVVGVGAGWVAGYRATKDVMVEDYLRLSNENELAEYGTTLTQGKWLDLRHEFITDPASLHRFHVGAAKASLPSVVFVAVLFFWLAGRPSRDG